MTRTVTALFDKRSDAEAAEARLKAANVDASHISIHDKTSSGFHATGHSTTQDPGMWASIKNAFLPDEDRHTYEEGVRRGGFLLTADVDEDHVDEVVRVLEEADTVDIDDRAGEWRSSGWDYAPEAVATGAGRTGAYAYGTDKDDSRLPTSSASRASRSSRSSWSSASAKSIAAVRAYARTSPSPGPRAGPSA